MGYPSHESAVTILKGDSHKTIEGMERVISKDEILAFQEEVENTKIKESLYDYAVSLTEATRNTDTFALGLSPRGSIALIIPMEKIYKISVRIFTFI